MSSKNNVNPDHYKVAGRGKPGDKKGQNVDRARYAQSKKKPESNFLPGQSEQEKKNARRPARARVKPDDAALDLGRAVNRNATAGKRRSRVEGPKDESAPAKRGQGSTTQKSANTRHGTNPSPAAGPVAGAFGKQGSLSETEESIVNMEPKNDPGGDDFIEVRRKQNKRARK